MSTIDDLVNRFLTWRLPDDFAPDGGVSFAPVSHPTAWPVGTNLLTATQARAMLDHVLGDVLADAAKSERRAIALGDIVQSHVIAMRAAVVAAKLEGLDVGMQWIANTLEGPGHLPDLDAARALGGAQALWDKETAEAEAFRAAHPAP